MDNRQIADWVEAARHDLDTVELLLANNGHPDVIINHMHQAVEKLLKALLLHGKQSFRKTHALDSLLFDALPLYPALDLVKASILNLDGYSAKLRYPRGDFLTGKDLEKADSYYRQICSQIILMSDIPDSMRMLKSISIKAGKLP